MCEQPAREHELHVSVAKHIFPERSIERTLHLLRDVITHVEVTQTSPQNIHMRLTCRTDAMAAMEDLFYGRLISTAVSLKHDEVCGEIKHLFMQTAMAATTEPQQTLKKHLMSLAPIDCPFPENRAAYWDGYSGYHAELGGGLDIFVQEHANTFHLDVDDSVYSAAHIQHVVDNISTDEFHCTRRTEKSRIIVSVAFQKDASQRDMFKTLLHLQKTLRTLPPPIKA